MGLRTRFALQPLVAPIVLLVNRSIFISVYEFYESVLLSCSVSPWCNLESAFTLKSELCKFCWFFCFIFEKYILFGHLKYSILYTLSICLINSFWFVIFQAGLSYILLLVLSKFLQAFFPFKKLIYYGFRMLSEYFKRVVGICLWLCL